VWEPMRATSDAQALHVLARIFGSTPPSVVSFHTEHRLLSDQSLQMIYHHQGLAKI
jgi:hypothetical protein